MKNTSQIKTNLQWAKDEEHHVKLENEDEIDKSHKSQLKFEYNVYLLNCTIKMFKNNSRALTPTHDRLLLGLHLADHIT